MCYYARAMARLFDAVHKRHTDNYSLALIDAYLSNLVIDAVSGSLLAIDPGKATMGAKPFQVALGAFKWPPEMQPYDEAAIQKYVLGLKEAFKSASENMLRSYDVWSMGSNTYRMLYGAWPFEPKKILPTNITPEDEGRLMQYFHQDVSALSK